MTFLIKFKKKKKKASALQLLPATQLAMHLYPNAYFCRWWALTGLQLHVALSGCVQPPDTRR